MKIGSTFKLAAVVGAAAVAGACSETTTNPQVTEPPALLSVQPEGGAMDVSVGSDVVVTFDHALARGMEEYAALHEGTVTGPEVSGTWTLSEDGTVLTFVPSASLKPATTYVIHIGGGMTDANGDHVDLDMHGISMGGQWATQSMMTDGMGGMGGMGGQTSDHMGAGWQHPSNGTYGMVFLFTTAA